MRCSCTKKSQRPLKSVSLSSLLPSTTCFAPVICTLGRFVPRPETSSRSPNKRASLLRLRISSPFWTRARTKTVVRPTESSIPSNCAAPPDVFPTRTNRSLNQSSLLQIRLAVMPLWSSEVLATPKMLIMTCVLPLFVSVSSKLISDVSFRHGRHFEGTRISIQASAFEFVDQTSPS